MESVVLAQHGVAILGPAVSKTESGAMPPKSSNMPKSGSPPKAQAPPPPPGLPPGIKPPPKAKPPDPVPIRKKRPPPPMPEREAPESSVTNPRRKVKSSYADFEVSLSESSDSDTSARSDSCSRRNKANIAKSELRGADEAEAIRIELEKRRRVAKIRSTKMPHFSGGDLSVI